MHLHVEWARRNDHNTRRALHAFERIARFRTRHPVLSVATDFILRLVPGLGGALVAGEHLAEDAATHAKTWLIHTAEQYRTTSKLTPGAKRVMEDYLEAVKREQAATERMLDALERELTLHEPSPGV